jgi:hypothetical protein
MVDLQSLNNQVLANGRIGEAEVQIICQALYPEGRIDREVVDFLISLREQAVSVCTTFELLLFDSVKHCLLNDGVIDTEEAIWLKQRLIFAGNLRRGEKKLLWDLRHQAKGLSHEFQRLYYEYM